MDSDCFNLPGPFLGTTPFMFKLQAAEVFAGSRTTVETLSTKIGTKLDTALNTWSSYEPVSWRARVSRTPISLKDLVCLSGDGRPTHSCDG